MASIIVIDDDQALCQAVAEILAGSGHDARMFYNGRKALRCIEDDPVDIIVTDLFMPEIDYLQAARSFGATSIIKKPFRAAELLEAVSVCAPG